MSSAPTAFALPDRLSAKADPALIARDDAQFAAIGEALERSIADAEERLDAARRSRGETSQDALQRDVETRELSARLRALRRYGIDLCLGRIVTDDDTEPLYIGRFGLTDAEGGRLLIDWRSPAAERFFSATHAQPMGLASRRRYRWTLGRITDYWDEVFTLDGLEGNAALDDQSAFIASLGSSRSSRMRDVLSTIQADQDAIIRAGSRGALVVDGGPGTGKTVVALHRTAYLLYADSRLARGRGGVLYVGPSRGYLAYVDDVLPSLGEDEVQICTLRDLVPEGSDAVEESDPQVAAQKAATDPVAVVAAALRRHEQPPHGSTVETPWGDLQLDAEDWAEAFGAAEDDVPHNEARDDIWQQLLAIVGDRLGGRIPPHQLDRLLRDGDLREMLDRAWPLLSPEGLVAELVGHTEGSPWTVPDLPFLDAAHQRIGDPGFEDRRRRQAADAALQRETLDRVVGDLIAADYDKESEVSMFLIGDRHHELVDEDSLAADPDLLAGPFAHIVVDEAQELTDAEWSMLLSRCPSRSFTIVGDRAQARHGFTESWEERMHRIGLADVSVATLDVNYRTPAEIMAEAEPGIRAAIPDANVPTSIRSTGVPVEHGPLRELDALVGSWLDEHPHGIGCVIGAPGFVARDRIRSLTPELAKGLEFDLVVLVRPDALGSGIEGAVDRYVAMTRATQQLIVLE